MRITAYKPPQNTKPWRNGPSPRHTEPENAIDFAVYYVEPGTFATAEHGVCGFFNDLRFVCASGSSCIALVGKRDDSHVVRVVSFKNTPPECTRDLVASAIEQHITAISGKKIYAYVYGDQLSNFAFASYSYLTDHKGIRKTSLISDKGNRDLIMDLETGVPAVLDSITSHVTYKLPNHNMGRMHACHRLLGNGNNNLVANDAVVLDKELSNRPWERHHGGFVTKRATP